MDAPRRAARLGGFSAAMLLLSGCWSQIGFGPEHRRHNDAENSLTIANVATISEAWTVPVEGTASELVTSDGRLYTTISGPNGVEVLAVDAGTGEEVWRETLVDAPNATGVPVALADGMLWTGYASDDAGGSACDSRLVQLDPATGTTSEALPGNVGSPAVSSGTTVLQTFRSYSGDPCAPGPVRLMVSDTQTDATWFATVPGTPSSPLALTAVPPTVVDGRVLVANGSSLSAYPLAGCGATECSATWTVPFVGAVDNGPPVGGETGQVFVTADDAHVIALAGDTGAELWRSSRAVPGQKVTLALADGHVWVATSVYPNFGPTLLSYDADGCGAETCVESGGTTVLPQDITSPPSLAGGVIYRGLFGRVEAFDAACATSPPASCPVLATAFTDAPVRAVSVAMGRLLVAGDGYIAAFAPA